jgi:ribose-phosphate pyrophosphokinase
MNQVAVGDQKRPLARLLFQVDDWRSALISSDVSEVVWQHGEYPNGEQWAKLDQVFPVETIEVFARFGSRKLPNYGTLAEQVQTLMLLLEASRQQCEHLRLCLPYLPYSLQDRDVRGGDAVAVQVFIQSVEAIGVDEVVLLDVHSPRDLEYWSIPVTHLTAEELLVQGIQESIDMSQAVLLAPDKGAAHRAHQMGERLDIPVTYLTKVRLGPGNVKMDTSNLDGLNAKQVILADDLLNTGGTLVAAAQALHERDSEIQVSVVVTHGLFAGEAMAKLQAAQIERVFVTDSFISEEKDSEFLHFVSVKDLFLTRS